MLNFVIAIVLCLTAFHFLTRFSRTGRIVNKLPGFSAYPIVGNLLKYNVTCPHEFWKRIRELTSTFYPILRVWFVRSPMISIRHPDDVEVLLTSQKAIDKGYIYDYLEPWLKTGLLTSTGEKWRQRRKILTPAFHFKILKKYLEIINEEGERTITNLKNDDAEKVISLTPFTSKFMLSVICEAAMGVALHKIDPKITEKYKKAIYDFGYCLVYRIPRPYIFNWLMKLPWKIGTMQRNAVKVLHEFSTKIIKKRMTYHENTQNKYLKQLENLDNAYVGQKKRLAMLDLLLAAEKNSLINYDGIQEEVDTFIFEGHDTTASAMTFALLLLAENKNEQAKARAEVTALINRMGSNLSLTDLQELHYLERCIKESMRLFPPVSTIFRHCREDLQLKNGLVPGGVDIVVHMYDLHRDPNFWPEPDKFNPDRFLTEECQKRHPFAYVPFSAGPRNCIGQKFALMELKTSLARILYDFYLDPLERTADIKLIADIVIRPLNPVSVKFIRINK